LLQFSQCAIVFGSFRESPVAKSDQPPVKKAPVAFAPLTPTFFDMFSVRTAPCCWQCGQTITGLSWPLDCTFFSGIGIGTKSKSKKTEQNKNDTTNPVAGLK
ncbi:MAG: hypothetical protein ABL888_21405, partial [Pirellulaceae bacterium]